MSKTPESKHLTPDSNTPLESKLVPRMGPAPAAGGAAAPQARTAADAHPSVTSRRGQPSASCSKAPAPAAATPATNAAEGTAPKRPPPARLDELLAALPPDELLPALRAQHYTSAHGSKRTGGATAVTGAKGPRAKDKVTAAATIGAAAAGATAPVASAAADAADADGDGDAQNVMSIKVDRQQVLLTCRAVSGRQLFTGPYRAEHVVGLVEVLASHCRGLEGAVSVAGSLAEVALGCCSQTRALEFLSGRARDEMARELPALLPRLLLALATLGYDGQEAWATATRLAHTHLRNYTGDQVALVVRAAVEVDSATAFAAGPAAVGPNPRGSGGTGGDSGGRSLGVQLLDHPAMRQRLQDLARDGGITADGAASVLLGLCIIGAGNTLETLGPLLRRALQERRELSPQGWVQLLQAVGKSVDPAGPSEVVALLQRYQTGLLGVLAAGVTAQAAAGRLRPVDLTDAAHSFARLRYLQEDFMKALATSVTRGIRSETVEVRDINTALYTTALFCNRTAAATELFTAAAIALRPRLRTLGLFNLGRLAWSYAVADGCKLLPPPPPPQQKQRQQPKQPPGGGGVGAGPGAEVQAFLKDLASELLSRESGLAMAAEARELVRHSIRIWCTLEAPSMPSPNQLLPLSASKHKDPRESAQHGRDETEPQGPGGRLQGSVRPASSGPDGAMGGGLGDKISMMTRPSPTSITLTGLSGRPSSGASGPRGADNTGGSSINSSSGASGANLPSRVSVSELQKLVFRELKDLGLRPRMEQKVGMWSVDICVQLEDGRGAALAVEVDGPSHFTTSQPPCRLGTTVARDACLRSLGLQVLPLDYRLYDKIPPARRPAMLRKLLKRTAGSAGRDEQQQQQTKVEAAGSQGG